MNTIKSGPYIRLTQQRGVILPLVAASMLAFVGFTTYGIDIANIAYNQNMLDNAVRNAALYGGQQLGAGSADAAAQLATATWLYTNMQLSSNNAVPSTDKCCTVGTLTGVGKGMKISQSAPIKLFFGPIIGQPSTTLTATAMASASGGTAKPANVMLILDTTGSMTTIDKYCNVNNTGSTQMACALLGAQSILSQLNSITDNVGVVVFPPRTAAPSSSASSGCATPTQVQYMWKEKATDISSGSYSTLAAAENNRLSVGSIPAYMTSLGVLNYASPIVYAVGGSSSKSVGCLPAKGNSTYYAQAFYTAQDNLCKLSGMVSSGTTPNNCDGFAITLDIHNGNPKNTTKYSAGNGLQNIIIFLSDGDANAVKPAVKLSNGVEVPAVTAVENSKYISPGLIPDLWGPTGLNTGTYDKNQCQQGVIASNVAKTAKTIVYSVSFYSPPNATQTDSGCNTDNSIYVAGKTTSGVYTPAIAASANIIPNGTGGYFGKNITACQTMAMIAGTTPSIALPPAPSTGVNVSGNYKYFYTDVCAANLGNKNASIVVMLGNIGAILGFPRIVSGTAPFTVP